MSLDDDDDDNALATEAERRPGSNHESLVDTNFAISKRDRRMLYWSSAAAAAAVGICLVLMLLQPTLERVAALSVIAIVVAASDWLRRRATRTAMQTTERYATRTAGGIASSLPTASDEGLEELRNELAVVAATLQRREQAFAERLVTFHEWMEFPEPIQLADKPTTEQDVAAAQHSSASDRQLFAVIEEETESLFNAIRDNKYTVNGKLDTDIARADAVALVRRVARIYQPDAKEPLLETSVALILRSVSRASLQLLVVLEQLPLDIKELSIRKMYGYVQTAVGYYGMYQKAKPYLPWATNAMYLGRYAVGASPLTLGAWYATSKLGTQLAKAATQRVINQQALQLIQNLVRLIAFEVAQMYSGDFRQRDPNWIYACELTQLVAGMPASAKTLSLALSEVGALQLRSEYDRLWFYRSLAAGQPAGDSKRASLSLRPQERLQIANRLERFVEQISHGQGEAVAVWRVAAEDRLGIKLGAIAYADGSEGVQQSLRSLGGFLLEVKQRPNDQWLEELEATRTYSLAESSQLEMLQETPPFLFEYPDLAPGGEMAQIYLEDLVKLAASLPRRGADVVMMMEEVAAFLRVEAETMSRYWSVALHDELQRKCGERLRGMPSAPCAACVLEQLDGQGEESSGAARIDGVYWPASIATASSSDVARRELVAVAHQGVLAAWDGESIEPVWSANYEAIHVEQQRGVLGSNCVLHASGQPSLVIEGAAWTRFQRYFAPLLECLG